MKLSRQAEIGFKYVLTKPKRAVNFFLIQLSKWLRLTKTWSKPMTAMIEPVNYCNLKCPLCPTGQGLIKRKKESLSLEDFKKIVNNLGGTISHIRLWNWGEPLINHELGKMIKYAKSKDICVNTSTNSFFLDDKIAGELIKSGLDQLIVSMDGASEETYNKYRKNGDFNKVIRVLKSMVVLKRKLGTKTPEIKLQFIIMKHNEHEVGKIIALAKEIGVDNLFLKTVGVMDPRLGKEIEKYIPSKEEFRRYVYIEGEEMKPVKLKRGVCDYLWSEVTVNVDGSVVPCCRDAHGSYVFGNLKKQKLAEIWNSEKMTAFRRRVLTSKDKIDICRLCSGSSKEFHIAEMKIK